MRRADVRAPAERAPSNVSATSVRSHALVSPLDQFSVPPRPRHLQYTPLGRRRRYRKGRNLTRRRGSRVHPSTRTVKLISGY
jgi:hypothetical protein